MALIYIWCFIGLISIFDERALIVYIAVLPVLSYFIYKDKQQLMTPDSIRLKYDFHPKIQLDESCIWVFHGRINGSRLPPNLILYLPKSRIFSSSLTQIEIGSLDFTFDFPIKGVMLGTETLADIYVSYESPRKLWRRLCKRPIDHTLQVKPSTHRLTNRELMRLVEKLGHMINGTKSLIKSRAQDQVLQIRPYTTGDAISHIDARKSARYHKLMVKEHESIINQHVVFGLDLGRSLTGKIRHSSKKDFFLEALLNLYKLAMRNRDKVSIFMFHQDLVYIEPHANRKGCFSRFLSEMSLVQAVDIESNYELILSTMRQLAPQRSIFMLLTDVTRASVQAQLLDVFPHLTRKHLALCSGLIQKENHINDFSQVVDHKNGWARDVYRYWLHDEFDRFQNAMNRIGSSAIMSSERNWQDMNDKTYHLLRRSLASG